MDFPNVCLQRDRCPERGVTVVTLDRPEVHRDVRSLVRRKTVLEVERH